MPWPDRPLNRHVTLEEALNVLMRPTDDDRVQIGLAPVTLSIATASGTTGHPVEIYPEHILTHGEPTEAVAGAYRQATSRVETTKQAATTLAAQTLIMEDTDAHTTHLPAPRAARPVTQLMRLLDRNNNKRRRDRED